MPHFRAGDGKNNKAKGDFQHKVLKKYMKVCRLQKGMVISVKKCMDSENLHRRLKKIIGQVQAIDRMVDEDIPCEDILSQLNAAKSALNKCGQVVLEGHINHCIKDAIESGDEEEIKNFTKAIERFANMQ